MSKPKAVFLYVSQGDASLPDVLVIAGVRAGLPLTVSIEPVENNLNANNTNIKLNAIKPIAIRYCCLIGIILFA